MTRVIEDLKKWKEEMREKKWKEEMRFFLEKQEIWRERRRNVS